DGTLVGLGGYAIAGDDFFPPGLTNVALFACGVAVSGVLFGPPAWPVFLQPLESQVAASGETVAFSALASAPRPLSYQWQFNGSNLPGQTNTTLVLSNVQPANAGAYRVIARVSGFVATAAAELAVDTQVLVIATSSDQAVVNGGTATFFVVAVADDPIQYQW